MSIQSEIDRINFAKTDIANALNEKGVFASTDAPIDSYGALVRQIPQSGEAVQEVMILTGVFDMSTAEISNLSHDYTQIVNALKMNKLVIAKINTVSIYGNTILYGYPSWSSSEGVLNRITIALVGRANFDGTGNANLLNVLTMYENGNNTVEINVI